MNKYEKIKCNYDAIKTTIEDGLKYHKEMALVLLESMEKEHLELVERATPKKIIRYCIGFTCPICGKLIIEFKANVNYCEDCGQKLDWTDNNE